MILQEMEWQATFFFSLHLPLMSIWLKKFFFPSFSSLFCKTLLVCLFDAQNKHSGNFSLFSPRCFGIMETLHHSLGSSHLPWIVNEVLALVRFYLLCYLEPKSFFFFLTAQKFTVRILHAISSFQLKSERLYWFFIWVRRWVLLTSVASIWK